MIAIFDTWALCIVFAFFLFFFNFKIITELLVKFYNLKLH